MNGYLDRSLRCGLMVCASLFLPAHNVQANDEIARLIEQLDSDAFAERVAAERELIARGRAILPAIMREQNAASREIATRCRKIFRQLHHQFLLDEFRRLGRLSDAEIDVEHGMYLVTWIQEPLVERSAITERLDKLAQEVRDELTATVKGRSPTSSEQLTAVRNVLFSKNHFTGNEVQYAHPANSSLTRVLETKRGLPLTLSHVTIAVARRIGLRLHGVALPRRYLVWYEPPPGRAADEMILDPYAGGQSLSRDDLEDLLAGLGVGFDQMADLKPATARETIGRALRNLSSHADQVGRGELSQDCRTYWRALGLAE